MNPKIFHLINFRIIGLLMMEPRFAVISPCYNEAEGIRDFILQLEEAILATGEKFAIIIIDDCSIDNTLEVLQSIKLHESIQLHVLSLNYNSGHQIAIYQGILYASELNMEKVVIMDSDGEDDPSAIGTLIKLPQDIVEVARGRRMESTGFKIGYFFYKIIFRLITGRQIRYGNYCMITKPVIEKIARTTFIHLPAYLLKQRFSRTSITLNRRKRIMGKSKMGIHDLLIHAFKSLVEFGEQLLMVFLKFFLVICLMIAILLCYLLYAKFISETAILGWFSTLTIGLINLAMISFGFFILGILLQNLIHQQTVRQQKQNFRVVKIS